ncbi:MAG: MucR family transcriptional regulator [Acidobacteriota bacterium]
MAKSLLEIAAEIVKAQATICCMAPEEIGTALSRTFGVLQRMRDAEETGAEFDASAVGGREAPENGAQPPVNPLDSIQKDRITCLECGVQARQLTAKHLTRHGLTSKEYKKKYGIPLKTPLSAKSLTNERSKAAKKRGLPDGLLRYREEKRRQNNPSDDYGN